MTGRHRRRGAGADGPPPRTPLRTTAALLLAAALLGPPVRGAELLAAVERPNVLFIAVDDLNCWAAGLSAYPGASTPNLDRLAERGVLFTNAHCSAPACNPSRTSVMTGVRPSTSGVYHNWQDWRRCAYLRGVPTLPEFFRRNGYQVLGGGKLYHAANLSEQGLAGYLDAAPWHDYFPSKKRQLADAVTAPGRPVNGSPRFYRGRFDWAALDIPDEEMGDAKVVAWAERQLLREHGRPLFLAVGIYRPHIPWHTPRRWFEKHPLETLVMPRTRKDDLDDVPAAGRAMARRQWHAWLVENNKWTEAVQAYLASVSFADAMVGRLLDALDRGPHREETVIVLWSDHGYHLGHKEHWEKFTLWEQATRVPLLLVAPSGVPVGRRRDAPASLLDIYPTLAELCRLAPPPHLEGRSLVAGQPTPGAEGDRAVVTTEGLGNHAVRSRRWRYIQYSDGSRELYDHRSDPSEFTNVVDEPANRAIVERLRAWLPRTNAALDPPRSTTSRE